MAEAAASAVVSSVSKLAAQETSLLCGVMDEVGFLKDELERLQGYVTENSRVAVWVSQIRDAAYKAENVIEAAEYMDKRNRLKKGFMGAISRKYKLEETAREYIRELAERSLVQVVDRSRAHGWIEKIRIHDILRDWCTEEARQDGVLDVIDKTAGQAGASSSNTMISYRTSFQNLCDDEIFQATPNLRTLVGFGSSISPPKLRFLRVLHVEKSSLKNFCRVIGGCIHLRCLRMRWCQEVTLPSSIGQLLYLQTIDLRDTDWDSIVPNSLWDIPTLRHVYLHRGFSPPNGRQKELQTLYLSPLLSDTKYFCRDMVTVLGQMTQLTTFFLDLVPIPAEMIKILAKNMPHLIDVHLHQFDVIDRLPKSQLFPQNLRQLSLRAFYKSFVWKLAYGD